MGTDTALPQRGGKGKKKSAKLADFICSLAILYPPPLPPNQCNHPDLSVAQVEQLTFLWVLLALIVLGNSTVLAALALSKGRKSRMNFFIRNLAAADLCVGLISVLTDIIWKITISWEAGLVACKAIRFSQVRRGGGWRSIDRKKNKTHNMCFPILVRTYNCCLFSCVHYQAVVTYASTYVLVALSIDR